MIIFPAIDIQEGKVVRLVQGKFDEVTEYSGSPVGMAKLWQDKGSEWLHVVDLDGAKTGELQNTAKIIEIAGHEHLRTGNKALVTMRFISKPEYIKKGMYVILCEGRTRAVGTVVSTDS